MGKTKDDRFFGKVKNVYCNGSLLCKYDVFGNYRYGKQSFDQFGNLIYEYYSYEPTFMGEPTEDYEYRKKYYIYNCKNQLTQCITHISKCESDYVDGDRVYDCFEKELITKYKYLGQTLLHKETTYSGANVISTVEYNYTNKKIKLKIYGNHYIEHSTYLLKKKTIIENKDVIVFEYEYDDFGNKSKFIKTENGNIKESKEFEYNDNNVLTKEISTTLVIEYSDFDKHRNFQLKTKRFKNGHTEVEKYRYEYYD